MSQLHHTRTVSAYVFSYVLLGLFVVVFAVSAVGFVFGISTLKEKAMSVSKIREDARTSSANIKNYEELNKRLTNTADVMDKYDALQSNDRFPIFTAERVIKKIAENNNVTIDISNATSTNDSTATTPGSSPAVAPAVPGASPVPTTVGDTYGLTVTFEKNQVNYKRFLQFLYDTEQSVPRLQVKGISMSTVGSGPSSDSTGRNPGTVAIEPIVIEMYVAR